MQQFNVFVNNCNSIFRNNKSLSDSSSSSLNRRGDTKLLEMLRFTQRLFNSVQHSKFSRTTDEMNFSANEIRYLVSPCDN